MAENLTKAQKLMAAYREYEAKIKVFRKRQAELVNKLQAHLDAKEIAKLREQISKE